jgi:hypothetical protein
MSNPHVNTEPSSWWPLAAMGLGALGSYALLVVHLAVEAADGKPWAWMSMLVPGALFFAAALTIAIGSGIPVRERLATIPAALLGYSPRGPVDTKRPRAGRGNELPLP